MTNSRFKKSLAMLLAVTVLLSASGATCQRQMMMNPFAAPGPAAPQILMEGATRDQIVAAVNQNSSRIQSITATGVTITIPDMLGLPLLSGNIAAERPGRFRLTAGTIAGQELDIGSNDELFWMWVRRNQPPAVYFCRHAEFANSNIRQFMPIEPSWLLAAMGIVDIDPASVFDGPLPSARGQGTVELRSWLPSASGRLQRVTVVDARRAWVIEQDIYDPSGTTLLASARADSHRFYPVEQVSLPDRVTIQLPTANLRMTINLGVVQINQLATDRGQLFALPTFDGYQQINLGGAVPGTPLPGPAAPSPLSGIVPTSYPSSYPTTPYPVTPAYSPTAPPTGSSSDAIVGPLPLYGQRLPATQPIRR
ncbi:MAG TPA: hypothetical protein VKH44_05825 [Pirellulaceae bacterium]|nr:hypothetical protein [Pirellulaceae bacterium]